MIPWRWCARWAHGVLVYGALMLAPPLLSCGKAAAGEPGTPITFAYVLARAPGDSLTYVLGWTPGARATGYVVTVAASATNGAWNGLPVKQAVTTTSITFTASAMPWDSVTFTATIYSTAGGLQSRTALVGNWKTTRLPGPPGGLTVDSSRALSILRLDIRPPIATLPGIGVTQQLCAFALLSDSSKAIFPVSDTIPYCRAEFATYLTERPA
jgi:hypothetical protein